MHHEIRPGFLAQPIERHLQAPPDASSAIAAVAPLELLSHNRSKIASRFKNIHEDLVSITIQINSYFIAF